MDTDDAVASPANSASANKIRVTVFLNGDYDTRGKLLIVPEGGSLAALIAKAALKLDADAMGLVLTRVFTAVGSEITDAEEVMPNDILYFSAGEEFVPPPPAPAADAAARRLYENAAPAAQPARAAGGYSNNFDAGAARYEAGAAGAEPVEGQAPAAAAGGGVLSSLAASAAVLAASAYGRASAALKEHGPQVLRENLGAWEAQAQPLMSSAGVAAANAAAWADARLAAAKENVQARSAELAESEAANTMRNAYAASAQTAEQLTAAAGDALRGLRNSPEAAMLGLYMQHVRARMGDAWNEQLAPAARGIYDNWQQHFAHAQGERERARFQQAQRAHGGDDDEFGLGAGGDADPAAGAGAADPQSDVHLLD